MIKYKLTGRREEIIPEESGRNKRIVLTEGDEGSKT